MTSKLVETRTWDRKEDHLYFHDTNTQAVDIVRRVHEGLPPATPARDAFETMRLVFAAEASADENRVISMSEIVR
jgi:predicted dehydrogenase